MSNLTSLQAATEELETFDKLATIDQLHDCQYAKWHDLLRELRLEFIQYQVDSNGMHLGQAKMIKSLHARIDELMFEFCSEEMTAEQVSRYENSQVSLHEI